MSYILSHLTNKYNNTLSIPKELVPSKENVTQLLSKPMIYVDFFPEREGYPLFILKVKGTRDIINNLFINLSNNDYTKRHTYLLYFNEHVEPL